MSFKGSSVFGTDKNLNFENEKNTKFYQSGGNFGNPMKASKGYSVKSSVVRNKGNSEFEREVEDPYIEYLEQVKGNNFRKNLLRNKCLALNS